MAGKVLVGLIYGGKSPEHEISKMTALSIKENIDKNKFEIKEIYIDKNGEFDHDLLSGIDIAFLSVHGPNCEDGTLQSFLENRGIKYTGSGINASKINMNKTKMHQIFQDAGLKSVKFIELDTKQNETDILKIVKEEIGFPCFLKPNNAGSSIGICKVNHVHELRLALSVAFRYDDQIIVEQAIEEPREIEIGILGNEELIISEPGEVLTNGEFYTYNAKYFDPFETTNEVSNLKQELINAIKEMAEQAYTFTRCRGYARIDFFLDKNNQIYINEINTLPGFTQSSMFPKLMSKIGIPYKELITKIIDLAQE